MHLYEPHEDSFILAKYVRRYANGNVLDVGTGTGIQGLSASESKRVKNIIGIDISKSAIDFCKENIKNKKIKFHVSDLFEFRRKRFSKEFPLKFDTIIFNPPYLPYDKLDTRDVRIYGGKNGYEIIARFLSMANDFLSVHGIILFVFSSLTNKEYIDNILTKNLFDSKILYKKQIFFEDLYVYLVKKSRILRSIEGLGISNIHYYSKGKHGVVYQGRLNKQRVAIKLENPLITTYGNITREGKWLKYLNKHLIAPKLIYRKKKFIVYKFVEGDFILDYFVKNKKKDIKKVIKRIFKQLYTLDKLYITKEEMHRPFKHILIKNNFPILLDFERAHYTKKPKNLTQFCDFLIKIRDLLKKNDILIDKDTMIKFAMEYKRKPNEETYLNIIKLL